MATRNLRRSEWHQRAGKWTRSLGHRGTRVRLFQKRKDGVFYRATWVAGEGSDVRSLGTRDRDEAERLGRQLLAALLDQERPRLREGPVRLGELIDAFLAEAPGFLDNAERTKADTRARAAVLRATLGERRDVRKLTEHDVRWYEAKRRAGGIEHAPQRRTSPVRQRSVQADLKLLKQMLNWACARPMPDGDPWLDRNPLHHVRIARERDVRRPKASPERYDATIAAMQRLQARYETETHLGGTAARRRAAARRLTWVRAEFALWLLMRTGHRRGAVMGLCWTDFDFVGRRLLWRAERDKGRKTRVVPYPEEFFERVRDFQRRLGAVGGYVFPQLNDPTRAAPSELLSQWIRRAEAEAGLEKLRGGTTHPYRRKWRSERRHLPLTVVAAAGGWDDFQTMNTAYDILDEDDLLEATAERARRVTG